MSSDRGGPVRARRCVRHRAAGVHRPPVRPARAVLALGLLMHRYNLAPEPGYRLHVAESLTLKPDGFRLRIGRRAAGIAARPEGIGSRWQTPAALLNTAPDAGRAGCKEETVPAQTPSPTTAAAARLLGTRWFARAPVWAYRARLGFLFGSRLLMLEHTGRKTGIRRYAVLEAVDHPDPATYIVAAGFGDRAQWLRNVRTSPRVRIWTGSRRPADATARPLTPQETAAALTAYARRHPRAWAALKPVFETTLGTRIDADGTSLPMIALDLADSRKDRTA